MTKIYTKKGGISAGMLILSYTIYVFVILNSHIDVMVGDVGTFNFTTVDRGTLYVYGVTDEESRTEWGIDVEFDRIIKYDGKERHPSRILTSPKKLSDGTILPAGTLVFYSWGYRDRAGMAKTWPNNQFKYIPLKSGEHHFVFVFGTEDAGYLKLDAYNEAFGTDDFFEELIYNEAGPTKGTAIFKLTNPTSKNLTVNTSNLLMRFVNDKGNSIYKYELSVYRNITEDVEKSYTCDYEFNYTLSPKYFWCFHNITENIGTNITPVWVNRTVVIFEHSFETGNTSTNTANWTEKENMIFWKDLTNANVQWTAGTTHTVKLVGYYEPSLGPVSNEWIPRMEYKGETYEQKKWAWWNLSWTIQVQILFHNDIDSKNKTTINNSAAPSSNCTATGGDCYDLRLVCNYTGSYVEYDSRNQSAFNTSAGGTTPMDFMINVTGEMTLADMNNTCWWYVGNPSAGVRPENKSNIYFWYNDMSSSTGWTAGAAWSFITYQGRTVAKCNSSSNNNLNRHDWGTFDEDNYLARFDILTDTVSAASLNVRLGSAIGAAGRLGNMISGEVDGTKWSIFDGGWTDTAIPKAATFKKFKWFSRDVADQYDFCLDSDCYLGATEINEVQLKGIEIACSTSTDKYIDDIEVFKHISPFMVTSLGSESTNTTPHAEMITANDTNYTTTSQTVQARAWDLDAGDTLNGTVACGSDTVNNASMDNYTTTDFVFSLSDGIYICNLTVSDGTYTNTSSDITINVDTPETKIYVRQANGTYIESDVIYDLWCSYYESQCEPENQDSTNALIQVENNGTVNGVGINCSINETVSNITAKMGNSSTYANAYTLTTDNTTIWSETIANGTNRSIYIWEDWQLPTSFDIIEYLCEVV